MAEQALNKLSEKQSSALEASIKHWEENLAARYPSQVSTSGDDCALCQEFCTDEHAAGTSCRECPVYLKTGQTGCVGSPWSAASVAYWWWLQARNVDDPVLKANWVQAATEELEFLKGLRDAD